jgi:hypothetical protein
MRGLKNDKRSETLLDGYIINYNFCRNHQSIKTTPAQSAGLQTTGWKQLIENSQAHLMKQKRQVLEQEVKVRK